MVWGEHLIEDSTFANNEADAVGALQAGLGTLRLHRCSFIDNAAPSGSNFGTALSRLLTGVAVCGDFSECGSHAVTSGAVMSSQQTLLEVEDCLFRNNTANPASFSTGALLAQILTARRSLGTPPSVLISQRNTFIGNAGGAGATTTVTIIPSSHD